MKKSTPETALRRISLLCSSALLIIGIFGMISGLSGLGYFMYETYGIIPISIVSSMIYILIGIALHIFSREDKKLHVILVGKGIVFAIMFLSFAVCIAFLANSDYDFQRALLGWAIDEENLRSSSISPFAAFGIFMGVIGLHLRYLLAIERNRFSRYIIGILGIAVFSLGAICLIGYAYGTPELYGGWTRPASIPSSIGLVVFGIGILATMNPMDWPLKIFFIQKGSYILIRYLVPLIGFLIIIIGWVIAIIIPRGQNAILLVAIFDILAVIFVSILISQILTIIDARLNRLQRDRNKALRELELAHEKLKIVGSLTRHDILNQLSVAKMEVELAKGYDCTPQVVKGLDNIGKINKTIEDLLKFQKEYQQIGEQKDKWLDLKGTVSGVISQLDLGKIKFENQVEQVAILADPMIEKGLYNIIENSIRHGGTVTKITIKSEVRNHGPLIISIEDNGVGIEETEKEKIFLKDVGKNTGLGLFLTREILRHSGMTIKETGKFGKGARFEIYVPPKRFKCG